MKEATDWFGPDSDGNGYGVTYTNWEAKTAHLCVCDWGYYGADCQLGPRPSMPLSPPR